MSKQSFFAGLAASGALTSGLRLVTKAIFDKTDHGLRKGVSKLFLTLFLERLVMGDAILVMFENI